MVRIAGRLMVSDYAFKTSFAAGYGALRRAICGPLTP